ncbi:MAG TPA: dihydrolipoamide acetyltransferase family protein [Ktedonobacterales bacterium]|nr:dihydrolipoamide acetyltransferase family protein [Ktedonobacterales bacterium]
MSQFLLPDLGEGLEEAQVVQWLVQVGDAVTLNQPICQVETAKALVDIPSPFAGTVTALHAQPGDTVPVGTPLLTIADAAATSGNGSAEDGGHGPVLVGYGTEGPAQSFTRRRRGSAPAAQAPTTPRPALNPINIMPLSPAATPEPAASPLVRKMAKDRGIDLRAIKGTGPGGRIRVEDLDQAATNAPVMAAATPTTLAPDEERISTVGLRKAIAARMVKAATTIPHFTEYSLFDATALVALRQRLKGDPTYAEQKLTYLPFFARALALAVQAYPVMNSRWDEEGNAIIIKHSLHLGIATDTPRGLLVPVIHNAHELDLARLAGEAVRLIGLARDGKLDAKSLSGSTITLTNVGASGPVDTGAPVINPPEACVVGFGALKARALVVGDEVRARPSCWISISCDHRIVDGATAAQFMGALVAALEQPEGLV